MKKAIKRLMLVVVFVLTFGLIGCGSTLRTDLSISDNFAGSRTMDVSIEKETLDEYAPKGDFSAFANETLGKVPECMEFSYEKTKNEYIFHFVMSFTSLEEYETQVEEILGKDVQVQYVYSKSPFTREISLKEDFSSEELLTWFRNFLVEKEYIEKEDVPYVFTKIENDIHINGKKYECDENRIKVIDKSYLPIKAIKVFSDLDVENETIARKIEIVFDKYNLNGNKEIVEAYLNSVIPEGAVGEWQEVEGGEKFVLLIPYCSEEELSAAMKTFCASDTSEVKLVFAGEEEKKQATTQTENWDKTVSDNLGTQKKVDSQKYVQPFGFETVLEETLDLSAFSCNGKGEITSDYYISATNGKPQSKLYYSNGVEVYGWDYLDETYTEYYFVETSFMPKYKVESNVNKYYVPSSIQMNTTVKSEEKVTREFVFIFDKEIEKNTLEKILQKADSLFEEHKDVIKISAKTKSNKTYITWKISGDVVSVDALCTEVFGRGYSQISYYCQDRVAFNRQYDYKEIIDLRPIFDWEYKGNVDYTLKMTGKVNKQNSVITGDGITKAKISGKKVSYLSDSLGYVNAHVVGTTVSKPILYGIIILGTSCLRVLLAVFVCARKKEKNKKKRV